MNRLFAVIVLSLAFVAVFHSTYVVGTELSSSEDVQESLLESGSLALSSDSDSDTDSDSDVATADQDALESEDGIAEKESTLASLKRRVYASKAKGIGASFLEHKSCKKNYAPCGRNCNTKCSSDPDCKPGQPEGCCGGCLVDAFKGCVCA